jgi:PadR family transcriptional regulator PadR
VILSITKEGNIMEAQYKKGVLELCVLSQLLEKDEYGYELSEKISSAISVTAGTLYLVLKRLKDNGYLTTYLVESSGGPARKYYHITEEGRKYHKDQKTEWENFLRKVEKLI